MFIVLNCKTGKKIFAKIELTFLEGKKKFRFPGHVTI
jgi:hypothetical protein